MNRRDHLGKLVSLRRRNHFNPVYRQDEHSVVRKAEDFLIKEILAPNPSYSKRATKEVLSLIGCVAEYVGGHNPDGVIHRPHSAMEGTLLMAYAIGHDRRLWQFAMKHVEVIRVHCGFHPKRRAVSIDNESTISIWRRVEEPVDQIQQIDWGDEAIRRLAQMAWAWLPKQSQFEWKKRLKFNGSQEDPRREFVTLSRLIIEGDENRILSDFAARSMTVRNWSVILQHINRMWTQAATISGHKRSTPPTSAHSA